MSRDKYVISLGFAPILLATALMQRLPGGISYTGDQRAICAGDRSRLTKPMDYLTYLFIPLVSVYKYNVSFDSALGHTMETGIKHDKTKLGILVRKTIEESLRKSPWTHLFFDLFEEHSF